VLINELQDDGFRMGSRAKAVSANVSSCDFMEQMNTYEIRAATENWTSIF